MKKLIVLSIISLFCSFLNAQTNIKLFPFEQTKNTYSAWNYVSDYDTLHYDGNNYFLAEYLQNLKM